MGKVVYGLKNVHYAIYDNTTKEYGEWKPIPGSVSLSADADSSQNDFYADDVVYATIAATSKETGSIEFAAITDEMYTDLFGYYVDSVNGMYMKPTEPVNVSVALGYEISGNIHKQRGLRYNVTFTDPSQSANSMTDSTNPDTVTANYTAIGRDFEITTGTGQDAVTETKNILKAHCDNSGQTHVSYDNFWNAVIEPGKASTSA